MHAIAAARKSFDPRNLLGCVTWLRSDLGITLNGSTVSTWANQVSGVSANASQSTAGKQPTYATGGLGGQPKLTFAAGQAFTWALDLAGAKSVMFVLKMTSEPHTGFSVASIKGSTGPLFTEVIVDLSGYKYVTFADDIGSFNSSGHDDVLGTTSGHVLLHTYSGSAPSSQSSYGAALDGAVKTVVASGAISRGGTDLGSIGGRLDASQNGAFLFNGDLYEIIVYNRVLSSQEQIDLFGYAKQLYRL